jgi:hypothetical protein
LGVQARASSVRMRRLVRARWKEEVGSVGMCAQSEPESVLAGRDSITAELENGRP